MDSDLAHQSLAGGLVYLGFVVALWITTDYSSRHGSLLLAVCGFSLACASVRLLLGYCVARLEARHGSVFYSGEPASPSQPPSPALPLRASAGTRATVPLRIL